jgi:hypothetical protein
LREGSICDGDEQNGQSRAQVPLAGHLKSGGFHFEELVLMNSTMESISFVAMTG